MSQSTCIFCSPDDEQQNTVIWRGRLVYIRWDNFPISRGHMEVVPFRHVESYFDLTEDEALEMFTATVAGSKIAKEFAPDGFNIGVNEGRAGGRTVPHVHLHLMPRYWGDVEDPRGGVRNILPGVSPDAWASPQQD